MTDERPTVAVDVDGTLTDHSEGWKGIDHYGPLLPGAKAFLEKLGKIAYVLIYTCRTNSEFNGLPVEELQAKVKKWLDTNDLHYDEIWIGQGKPVAAAYVDDRSVVGCLDTEPDDWAEARMMEDLRWLLGEPL